MGLFGVSKIKCPKNEWTTLISNHFAGMPASWNIKFRATDGSKVQGKFVETRWWLVIAAETETGNLSENMIFNRYWINTIYSVRVCPAADLIAEF